MQESNTALDDNTPTKTVANRTSLKVFILLWLILFVLYLPVAKAGWVNDTVDWLKRIREEKFWSYINIIQTLVPSLYQFTQFTTYIFYKIFGAHPWPWHLLFITLHAANGTLIYVISSKLFKESEVKNAAAISMGAVVLFCICPHISEVIVWKACYHYLQGMLLMLAILYWIQKFYSEQRIKYAVFSGTAFFLSTFSLELFYLTPLFALTLTIFYRKVLNYDKAIFKKVMLYFIVPIFLFFALHFYLLRTITGFYVAHLGPDFFQPAINYLRKAPIYLFHVLFLGRFFSEKTRQVVYDFFVTTGGLVMFYGFLVCLWTYIIIFFKKITTPYKVAALIFSWLMMCFAILSPVWIEPIQYVRDDRYAYYLLPLMYLLAVFFLANLKNPVVAKTLFVIYAIINIVCTIKVNLFWRHSSQIVYKLTHSFPETDNKIVLMLNVPANMNGVLMIGSLPNSAFKTIYNVNNDRKINSPVYDVASYNMITPEDGVHVTVFNDSIIHVTLNQWGTWWWYGRVGASNYENKDYKFNLVDPGHWYELILKHPADQYMLFYQVGDQWKIVDKNKLNIDQG